MGGGGWLEQIDIPDQGRPENSAAVKLCTFQTLNRQEAGEV